MKYDQAGFMRHFNETYREEFNHELFERDNNEMVDVIYKILKSCEVDKYFSLKLLKFTPIYDYEEIYNTLRAHEQRRKKRDDKSENIYDFIQIRDTDMILCKAQWLVVHNGVERIDIDNKTVEVVNPSQTVEVLIALPRFVKRYYFRISGNYYSTIFQIVDGSTYNNSTANNPKTESITFKSMSPPVRLYRGKDENIRDLRTGLVYKATEYVSAIFNTNCNAMYYIFAAYGYYGACEMLGIKHIQLTSEPILDPNYLCFEKNGIYVSVPEILFQDSVVQSMVVTFLKAIGKDTILNDLFNQRYWLKLLGGAFKNSSIDKGLFVLDSVDRILDLVTKEDLHLPESDKENIYMILRWMMREFKELRLKENVDIRTKRIRIAKYIGQMYAARLNKGIHRVSDVGRRVTLKKVIQAIYTQPMIILNNISGMSNLVAYRVAIKSSQQSQRI